MKVLIAPDKFKGSLPAAQVLHHLGSGLAQRGVHHRGLPRAVDPAFATEQSVAVARR